MIANPNLIYNDPFVFCSIPRLFVYLRLRMSTSKQYANEYVNQYSKVRGPLRECHSIRSGASGLPYYCAPLLCLSAVIDSLAVWRYNKPKTKNRNPSLFEGVWMIFWVIGIRQTWKFCTKIRSLLQGACREMSASHDVCLYAFFFKYFAATQLPRQLHQERNVNADGWEQTRLYDSTTEHVQQ